MEKVKITIEQEKALKFLLALWEEKSSIEIYEVFLRDRAQQLYFSEELVPLNEISAEDFFFVLHGWYEVEKPKFKVGDWVFDKVLNKYFKFTNDHNYFPSHFLSKEPFEKVTEHWKIVLLEAGRGKPELKIGDKYITKDNDSYTIEFGAISFDYHRFKDVEYFYPVESRIKVK